MLSHRDDCIAALLPELVGASKWLSSSQADFFGATLFPDLGIVDALGNVQGIRWEKYLELRLQVIDLEASLAEEWLSPELMSALRSENLRGDLTEKRSVIDRQVKAQVVDYLRSGSFNSRRLADIVNYIRLNPEIFSEWHQSVIALRFANGEETAKLFAPRYSETPEKPPAISFSGMGHLAVGESCVARAICRSYLIELWHEALIFLREIRMCVGRSRAGVHSVFLRSSLRCRTAITLDSLSLLCTFFYLHVKSKCFGT